MKLLCYSVCADKMNVALAQLFVF